MDTLTNIPAFADHLQAALQAVRTAFLELLEAAGADPGQPQELARKFGLNRNLTWKISRVVGSADLYAAVPHLPGPAGMEIFVQALEKAGAPAHLVRTAREAARELNQVVKVHTGDRTTLEIMVNGMLPASVQSEQSEQSRKLAYQGNSGVWGVRAKAQVALQIIAPSADDPDLVDLVQVAGLVGFRRLRPDARWLLFRRERWSDDDPSPPPDVMESLDPAFPVDKGVPFIGPFCSQPIPDVEVISAGGEEQYELPPGPVGNTAALTCIYGHVSRKVGRASADREGEFSEIGSNLTTPTESFVLDQLVHRDFEWAMNPELILYSRLDGGAARVAARRERNYLPVVEPVHDLGLGIMALASSTLPRYSKLARYVFDRVGWRPEEFRAFRFAIAYPPIPSAALMRSELPVKSSDGATERRSDGGEETG